MDTTLLELAFGLVLFSFTLTLWYFKREMKAKMRYREFRNDAIDGMTNRFHSNRSYGYASTKGIALIENEDGTCRIVSQSKLYDTSIDY